MDRRGFFGATNVQWNSGQSSDKSHEEQSESPALRLQLVFGQIFLWITLKMDVI